jgi:hypothetical protein
MGMTMLRVNIGSSPNGSADHMNSIEPVSPDDVFTILKP